MLCDKLHENVARTFYLAQVKKIEPPSQRSNARRVRSSHYNFTKENTDECQEFHFNRKT